VIRPAAFCGVVGFVPSTDRIPTDGVVPRSPSIDAVGLFTQDIAGMTTASAVACLDWTPVESVDCPTLGIPDDVLERATPAAVAVFREQVDTLRNAGFAVRRADAFEDLAAVDDWHRALTR
jgi:Asp-tRNA(Asn)/Glu-tRNA(Gln) amidotransferase A subunit family amidase